jgi:3-dehydrotetronate 4-kinase
LLEGDSPQPFPNTDASGAVLSGSCSERTGEQIACFAERHPVLQIDLLDQTPAEAVVHNALQWVAARLAAGPMCVATSSDQEAIEAAQPKWGREGAARRAEIMLGGVAQDWSSLELAAWSLGEAKRPAPQLMRSASSG